MALLGSIFRVPSGVRQSLIARGINGCGDCGPLYMSRVDFGLFRRLTSSMRSCGDATTSASSRENLKADDGSSRLDGTSSRPNEDDAKFKKGKYPGLGLPKAVGQPDDLPSIEFGKPTGMYNFVRHQHGDPRGHLQSDGRYRPTYASDSFHWYDAYTDVPKQKFTIVDGETMIVGKATRPMEDLFGIEQTNIPFHPRRRLNVWGSHRIVLSAEFCFFWIPTFIILGLAVPCYTMIYMMDEAVATSMTVKVIGHQWYWVYEVESPPVVESESLEE
ncbi:Cytochrome c oxidase subunit 1+2 [Babesia sp. Xinjiang]|uniref:Cytochrome c oxidase subunit 1+2 n=1 Tax=Babesia sp. Xinjiang TaxID=462227 RepID=UPI000A230634|nr:Cytochrome c oxidase subunit 1+2 [Babesia sp. Xinjiang]ORM40401.1 Cytochrome c oxidase subunit 1+2 [Babesia sp. Xinjiang]